MSLNQLSSSTEHDIGKFVSKTRPVSEPETVDNRLRHLKQEVLPFYPFLLTVPTDVPFRLGSRFVNNWAVGADGPFSPEEQQLQYMTFLTHHERDSLLLAIGDWSDGAGNVMHDRPSEAQSAASTPNGALAKKKITLDDYKNKKNNEVHTFFPETAKRSASASQESFDDQHSSNNFSIDDGNSEHQNISSFSKSSARPGFLYAERTREPQHKHEKSRRREKGARGETRSPKRTSNGVPALLSPTLPSTSTSSRLPQLLSPTLPPHMERELATFHEESHKRSTPNSLSIERDDVLDIKPSDHTKSGSVPGARPDNSDFSTSSTSEMQPGPIRKVRPHPSPNIGVRNSPMPLANSKSHPHPRQGRPQLIVRLKYGRTNKKRVEALLKFSGKRKEHPGDSHGKGPCPSQGENYGDKEGRWSNGIGKPRYTPITLDESGRSNQNNLSATVEHSKEPRIIASSEEPGTPSLSSRSLVPVRNEHGNVKSSVVPVRDSKHLHPTGSRDDSKARPSSRSSAKVAPGHSEIHTKLSPPQSEGQGSHSRLSEIRAWRDEYHKYKNLGRELKHAAERYTVKDYVTGTDEKLAAVTAIEAILCFILAFVADDQYKYVSRQAGDSSTWLSILAYWRVVKKNSTPYRHLYNLCLILGAVSYEAIHALDLERLSISALPNDHTMTPTPGSDGNTAPTDDSKRNQKDLDFVELKGRLPECYNESRRLWIEGSRGFTEEVLTREFPVTWSKRSMDYSNWGNNRLKVGEYSGEYFLPLGKVTTPVEVVRFSWSILSEWCSKEHVTWDGRLRL